MNADRKEEKKSFQRIVSAAEKSMELVGTDAESDDGRCSIVAAACKTLFDTENW